MRIEIALDKGRRVQGIEKAPHGPRADREVTCQFPVLHVIIAVIIISRRVISARITARPIEPRRTGGRRSLALTVATTMTFGVNRIDPADRLFSGR